eukprot:COSAG01_NODE_8827_length_2646_cov_3.001963_2_plen_73_part_00
MVRAIEAHCCPSDERSTVFSRAGTEISTRMKPNCSLLDLRGRCCRTIHWRHSRVSAQRFSRRRCRRRAEHVC